MEQRDEEASGRLDAFLVRSVSRLRCLAGRAGVGVVLVVGSGLAVDLATWVGAANQHTGVSLPTLLEAGLNASIPGGGSCSGQVCW